MFKRIIHSLFGSPRPVKEPFHDPVLGEMKPDETGWTASVSNGDNSFEFTIGGSDRPDAALLAHAYEILNEYEAFKKMVTDCIEAESHEYPEEVKAELNGLEIDDISLFWPERPDDGMIFFRGPANYSRLWRCDYIARKPSGLGCDT